MNAMPEPDSVGVPKSPRSALQEIRAGLIFLTFFTLCVLVLRYIGLSDTFFTDPRYLRERSDNLIKAGDAVNHGDFDEAEEILKRLIEKQPNFGLAHYRLGCVYLQKDRLDEALVHFEKAALYMPDSDGAIAKGIELVKARQAARKVSR